MVEGKKRFITSLREPVILEKRVGFLPSANVCWYAVWSRLSRSVPEYVENFPVCYPRLCLIDPKLMRYSPNRDRIKRSVKLTVCSCQGYYIIVIRGSHGVLDSYSIPFFFNSLTLPRGCKISRKTKTSLERWHCRATGSGMDEDSKGQRKREDSGGGLLPAVEGHSLE